MDVQEVIDQARLRADSLRDILGTGPNFFDRVADALEALNREAEAYKRAKAENDERFMIERDEARAEVTRLNRENKTLTEDATTEWGAQRPDGSVFQARDMAQAYRARYKHEKIVRRTIGQWVEVSS